MAVALVVAAGVRNNRHLAGNKVRNYSTGQPDMNHSLAVSSHKVGNTEAEAEAAGMAVAAPWGPSSSARCPCAPRRPSSSTKTGTPPFAMGQSCAGRDS